LAISDAEPGYQTSMKDTEFIGTMNPNAPKGVKQNGIKKLHRGRAVTNVTVGVLKRDTLELQ
jgi:hypothetical protein